MGPFFTASDTTLNSTLALFQDIPFLSPQATVFTLVSCLISWLMIHFLFPELMSSSTSLPAKANAKFTSLSYRKSFTNVWLFL